MTTPRGRAVTGIGLALCSTLAACNSDGSGSGASTGGTTGGTGSP